MKLTLRPEMTFRTGSTYDSDQVFQYLVVGVPSGESISIGEDANTKRWRTYRERSGWTGDYASAEEALAALERELGV